MEDRTDGGPGGTAGGPSGVYETEDGQLVLYEEGNPDAYMRSDHFVDVEL
jgi:hypothetical protein